MKKNNEQIKYFLYARKSSESEDRQIQSIDDQINKLKELAKKQDIKIVKTYEESKSAKMPYNRPIFTEMLERIEKGEAQGILCWQINRLTRNPVDGGKISWLLQKGVLKSIQTMEKEYLPEDNTLLLSVETGMANQFIIDLRKNVKRGMNGKVDRGDYPTKPPLGYKNDKEEKKIIVDEKVFPLVRKMWDLMLTGNYAPSKILTIANNEWGFRTPRTKRGGDRPIAMSTIYRMFNNIFYTGSFAWNKETRTGNHKPMITIDEYDRVQFLLGKKGKPRFAKHNHPYTGIIKCEECGCLHTASTKFKQIKCTGEIKSFTYYYCTRRTKRVECSQKKVLTIGELEQQIDEELQKCTIAPKFFQWAMERLSEANELEVTDRVKIYESQQSSYTKLQAELDNLAKMLYKELISEDDFTRMRDDLRTKLATLKLSMQSTEDRAAKWLDASKEVFDFVTFSRARLHNPETTSEDKRKILTSLGWNFTMLNQKLNISKYEHILTIENKYPPLESRLTRLELNKTLTTTGRNIELDAIRSDWCAYRDSNSN
ncbi:MAG: recombinase family protein [Candidatus Pacebacteria bacterium]|nr:recombinase family protein [Candidatus Paceibacterota bacterium]